MISGENTTELEEVFDAITVFNQSVKKSVCSYPKCNDSSEFGSHHLQLKAMIEEFNESNRKLLLQYNEMYFQKMNEPVQSEITEKHQNEKISENIMRLIMLLNNSDNIDNEVLELLHEIIEELQSESNTDLSELEKNFICINAIQKVINSGCELYCLLLRRCSHNVSLSDLEEKQLKSICQQKSNLLYLLIQILQKYHDVLESKHELSLISSTSTILQTNEVDETFEYVIVEIQEMEQQSQELKKDCDQTFILAEEFSEDEEQLLNYSDILRKAEELLEDLIGNYSFIYEYLLIYYADQFVSSQAMPFNKRLLFCLKVQKRREALQELEETCSNADLQESNANLVTFLREIEALTSK